MYQAYLYVSDAVAFAHLVTAVHAQRVKAGCEWSRLPLMTHTKSSPLDERLPSSGFTTFASVACPVLPSQSAKRLNGA